jgi:succinoglycan biosynthesis protein ExoA
VTDTPSVSVILPTLNERAFIRDCLDSLIAQDYSAIEEVLVVDGGSGDGTRDIVSATGGRVRMVDNPRVTAAAAMNIGIGEAKGDVIVRADAHTLYAADYVRRCVEVLLETEADNVGGLMRPVGATRFGRAVGVATSSPIGVGPGKFHYGTVRQDVDTVYLGCWRRTTLLDLGGYDESKLQWAAEDQELNFRLRRAGGRILLDPSIRSTYFVRDTPRALWRQYFNYGVCKASTLVKHRALPTMRPLAPAALVAAAAAAVVTQRGPRRIAIPVLHALGVAAALRATSTEGIEDPVRTFAAVEICHWSYGFGFWSGLARALAGREFESRPRGHR